MGGEVRAGKRVYGAAATAHARGPTQGLGAKGTRGERTWNMSLMVVTLEVSKLSGWLNTDARCRVEGRACDAGERGASREAGVLCGVWWRHTRGMHGDGPTQSLGANIRAARAESAR
jgi:hypothetical protein